jgi:hypothetical protein
MADGAGETRPAGLGSAAEGFVRWRSPSQGSLHRQGAASRHTGEDERAGSSGALTADDCRWAGSPSSFSAGASSRAATPSGSVHPVCVVAGGCSEVSEGARVRQSVRFRLTSSSWRARASMPRVWSVLRMNSSETCCSSVQEPARHSIDGLGAASSLESESPSVSRRLVRSCHRQQK